MAFPLLKVGDSIIFNRPYKYFNTGAIATVSGVDVCTDSVTLCDTYGWTLVFNPKELFANGTISRMQGPAVSLRAAAYGGGGGSKQANQVAYGSLSNGFIEIIEEYQNGIKACNHVWLQYTGITEAYEFCKHCDEKRR